MTIGDRKVRTSDALIEQCGCFADCFVGRVGHEGVCDAQNQPRAVGVAGFQRPAHENAPAARSTQEIGEIVAVQIALFGGQQDRFGQHDLEHPAHER